MMVGERRLTLFVSEAHHLTTLHGQISEGLPLCALHLILHTALKLRIHSKRLLFHYFIIRPVVRRVNRSKVRHHFYYIINLITFN